MMVLLWLTFKHGKELEYRGEQTVDDNDEVWCEQLKDRLKERDSFYECSNGWNVILEGTDRRERS